MLAGFSKEMKRNFLINWVIRRNDTAISWRKLNQCLVFIGKICLLSLFLFCCVHKLNREKRCEISGMFWLKFLIFGFKLQCTTSLYTKYKGNQKLFFVGWHIKYIIYKNQGFEVDQNFDLPHWTTLYYICRQALSSFLTKV